MKCRVKTAKKTFNLKIRVFINIFREFCICICGFTIFRKSNFISPKLWSRGVIHLSSSDSSVEL